MVYVLYFKKILTKYVEKSHPFELDETWRKIDLEVLCRSSHGQNPSQLPAEYDKAYKRAKNNAPKSILINLCIHMCVCTKNIAQICGVAGYDQIK